MLIDTHCHLDFKDFDADRAEAINRARDAGVGIILNVGSSFESSKRSVELASAYDFIYAAVGVHPHDVQKITADTLPQLELLAESEKVVAIGEVGLDYYRDLSPRDIQKKYFREFIRLSKKLGLPLILHNRDADADMIKILKEEYSQEGAYVRGVMHCFSGDEKFLKECLSLGLYISFTGNLTFKNANDLREVAKKVPTERFLLETDAPFLAPQAQRGKRNEPAFITCLAEEMSRLQGLSVEDVERISAHNADELFDFNFESRGRAQIAYPIRDSLYLNITNNCTNECYFCVRFFSDFVKGHKLKLEREPSTQEILDAINNLDKDDKYREIVFCGYGEPTLRLDALKEIAASVKKRGKKTRLVTNGHGNLINKRSIVKELSGLIDKVSVSLNADTADKYNKVCSPKFGCGTFEEVKRFIRECREAGIEAEVTCLDIPEVDVEQCRLIAEKYLGADFRLRRHNVVG